jgi:glycosyltransferase involved in cell wall biosynthesis
MADLLSAIDGVEMLGFVQPADLPDVFSRAGCLVLPSRVEPWGVVVHEAVSAGLPVVCTRVCGAATRLVLDGYNGTIVSAGDDVGLARALARISAASPGERRAMGAASESLSLQYTPTRWASMLVSRIPELRDQVGLDQPAPPRVRSAGD